MEDYYDHCERNPEGFERLRIENFERETREQIQNEARQLGEKCVPPRGLNNLGSNE